MTRASAFSVVVSSFCAILTSIELALVARAAKVHNGAAISFSPLFAPGIPAAVKPSSNDSEICRKVFAGEHSHSPIVGDFGCVILVENELLFSVLG